MRGLIAVGGGSGGGQDRAAARVGVALEALEVGAHFGGVLVAQIAILFQGAVDDVLELGEGDRD